MRYFLECDGIQGGVEMSDVGAHDLTVNNSFSVAVLAYVGSLNNNILPRFWEKGAHFMCFMGDATNGKYRKIAIETQNSTGVGNDNGGASEFWGSTNLEVGKTYHIVGTFNGDLVGSEPSVYQGKIWINGVPESMDNIYPWPEAPNDQLASTSNSMYLMKRRTDSARCLQGRETNIYVWNRALDPDTEAPYVYKGQIPATGLVSNFDFKGASGNTATDRTGNSNGTITSLTYRRMWKVV